MFFSQLTSQINLKGGKSILKQHKATVWDLSARGDVFLQDWNQTLTFSWIQCVSTCVSFDLKNIHVFRGTEREGEKERERRRENVLVSVNNQSSVPQPAHNQEQKNRSSVVSQSQGCPSVEEGQTPGFSHCWSLSFRLRNDSRPHSFGHIFCRAARYLTRLPKKSAVNGEPSMIQLRPKINFDASYSVR